MTPTPEAMAEIERGLREGPLRCENDGLHPLQHSRCRDFELCAACCVRTRVARWVAEREATLNEQLTQARLQLATCGAVAGGASDEGIREENRSASLVNVLALRARVAELESERVGDCGERGHKDCPNCEGTGSWWDMVWETWKRCPCKPEWRAGKDTPR